ncbi:S1 RNA-binding domain-containing protein [Streptomyces sp. Marseille-Q5077]|uniref:S1 RNA-binding domain-containing protein n=1 Tax=Streptomyces sp. Marseille-Q5077 TaxID=3418995 RepID=UPI003CFE0D80
MIEINDELDVTVTLVSPVGVLVDMGESEGFIDLRKHPSWWEDAVSPKVGDRLHVVVLDDSRTPPRLSALSDDIEIARRVRAEGS